VKELLHIVQLWVRDLFLIQQAGIEDASSRIFFKEHAESMTEWLGLHSRINLGDAMEEIEKSIDYIEKNVYIFLIILTLAQNLRKIIFSSRNGLQ